MTLLKQKTKIQTALSILVGVLFVIALVSPVYAQATLQNRSLQISDPRVDQTNVNYTVGFSITGAGDVLGSFTLLFCSNSPLLFLPCDPIAGFDASAATVISQTGITGFSVAPGAMAGSLLLTRTADFVAPTDIRVELGGITNPSNIGTNYGRLQIFSSEDATGVALNEGGVTFVMTPTTDIETEVPPYLFLCVAITLPGYLCDNATGNFIDLGELSSTSTKAGTSQILVATNAGAGFVVYITGTPPTSGNNVIPGLATPQTSQTGKSQFGINLRDNSNPDVGSDPVGVGSGVITADYNTPNLFKYITGDALVSSNTTTADKKFTVSYVINVKKNEKPGLYSTTLLYTALATF